MSDAFRNNARAALIAQLTERGTFAGELSASALSTATAAVAFALAANATGNPDHQRLAERARAWIAAHQNSDGGWGDTIDSPTNISTTTLCWSALGFGDGDAGVVQRAEAWLSAACGDLSPASVARAIRARYGKDHTFSTPILVTCAISGRLGEGGWRFVPALPFELAAAPHSWFKALNLRMVSYALPALIAVGQARHFHHPSWNPLRALTRRRTLGILERIQPASGGFLEAAPLTSFVAMSLLSMGMHDHGVVKRGLDFLADTARGDGSWPIDTNLEVWTTTLAVNALGSAPGDGTRAWLGAQQYTEVHPYTHADPGGWAWTDLPGGVPDADDTSGALLALHKLDPDAGPAAARGITWLLDLQNRDGGIPTFCRGWGKLPFDQSCPDITAHALRAWRTWSEAVPGLRRRIDAATHKAIRYLERTQREDGAWIPLWFGNQAAPKEENPLYGTTRVLLAGDMLPRDVRDRAMSWLLRAQHQGGGFGGAPGVPPCIEETALAIEALSTEARAREPQIQKALAWLADATDNGTRFPASPIGLYFAKLWYSERLYPIIFTVSALERVQCPT